MLDQFHWQPEEQYFLALMESGVLTISEVRELSWTQIRNTFDGLLIMERSVSLRPECQDGLREMLEKGTGLYGEPIAGKDSTGLVFRKDTLKSVSRQLDQFKDE